VYITQDNTGAGAAAAAAAVGSNSNEPQHKMSIRPKLASTQPQRCAAELHVS